MTGALTDEELMVRVVAGDQAAFRVLVERHRGAVMRLAYGVVREAAEAEDIVQDAFERVWRAAGSWRAGPEARFYPWLARITLNRAIDRQRRPKGVALDQAGEPADDGPDAERRAAGREVGRRIRAALSALPERQRLAFGLCQLERRSNEAAARQMGVSLGALELLLVRARKAMRRALADLTEE